jgi:hypothetical protein
MPNQVVAESKNESVETKIYELLNKGEYTSEEIIKILNLDWDNKKLTSFLKSHAMVQTINKKPLKFTIKQSEELSLFNQQSN